MAMKRLLHRLQAIFHFASLTEGVCTYSVQLLFSSQAHSSHCLIFIVNYNFPLLFKEIITIPYKRQMLVS